MSTFRTYFSKDNVIISNKYVNTGLNPVTELFYGTNQKIYSRYIFDFNIDAVKERILDKRINSNIKHILKLTNTLLYDKSSLGVKSSDSREHASSFDLVLFKVPQSWDEGTGYDVKYNNTVIDINGKVYETSSNWFQRTDITNWDEPGIYSGITSTKYQELKTIHFDLGNENIELDITDIINNLIIVGTTNFNGLGLAFKRDYELLITDSLYSVGFFSKNTNTFFEPFIETVWNENILDDRNDFQLGKNNKLYLYTNIRKEPTNLDILPQSVIIKNYNDETVSILTGITHEAKGVYSVSLNLSLSGYTEAILTNFTDKWTGLNIQGVNVGDVEMSFTIRENNYFNLGSEVSEPDNFTFNFSGLKRGEKISKGEVRKIIILVKPMFGFNELVINDLTYRIYINQGREQIDIITNSKVNRTSNQNYFYLDTSWLIPQDYHLELSLESNGTIIKKDDITFTVLDVYTGNINYRI